VFIGTGGDVRQTFRTVMPAIFFLLVATIGCAQEEYRIHIGDDVLVESGEEVDSAVAVGGDVRIYGSVLNDVVSIGGSVFLGPHAVVKGDVVTIGGMVVKQEGAEVLGDISTFDTSRITSFFREAPTSRWKEDEGVPFIPGLFPFLGFLALALIVVALIPERVDFVSFAITRHTGMSLLWGVIGALLIFPVALILVVSLVGILLIPFELIAVAIAFFLGYVAVVRIIGRKIFAAVKKPETPMVLETLAGSIILWAAGLVPYVGWMVMTAASLIGFGGFIASLIHRRAYHVEYAKSTRALQG